MLTRILRQTSKRFGTRHLSSFTPTTTSSSSTTTTLANQHKLFRDVTTFNNGTSEPTPGLFSCPTPVGNQKGNLAHLIVDCRNSPKLTFEHTATHPLGQQENIISVLARMLDITATRARFLVDVGAVYLGAFPNLTMHPNNLEHMPPMQQDLAMSSMLYLDRYIDTNHYVDKDETMELEVLDWHCLDECRRYNIVSNHKYKVLNLLDRVVDPNIIVKTGNYLMVALHPIRSPTAMAMTAEDWRDRVLYEDESVVVIDKPAGIVSIPTIDNVLDNVAVEVGKMIGFQFPPQHFHHAEVNLTRQIQCEMLPFIPDQPVDINSNNNIICDVDNNNSDNNNNNIDGNTDIPDTFSNTSSSNNNDNNNNSNAVGHLRYCELGLLSDQQIQHAQMHNLKIQPSPPPSQPRPAGSEMLEVWESKGRNYLTRRLIKIFETRPYLILYTMQRLDTGTSGCMLLAKTKAASNKWKLQVMEREKIRKFYTAFCFSFENPSSDIQPVPLGGCIQYLNLNAKCTIFPTQRRTRAHSELQPGRKQAEMIVTDVRPFEFAGTTASISIDGTGKHQLQLWEINIELKTGKTHQIRAQLETFGVCIVGDTLYPGTIETSSENNLLDTTRMDGRLGLQACRLELLGLDNIGNGSIDRNEPINSNAYTDYDAYIETISCNAGESDSGSAYTGRDAGDYMSFVAHTPWWKEPDCANDVTGIIEDQLRALKDSGMLNVNKWTPEANRDSEVHMGRENSI